MKKLFIAIGIVLGLVSPAMPAPSSAQTPFESVLYASKQTGELMPVWERFVNTQFFVVVIRNDVGQKTKDFRFSVFNNPVDKKSYVLVSEHLERLDNVQSGEAIRVFGAQLIRLLQSELGIVIGLNDREKGGFVIPNGQVQWLRASIQPNG